MRRLDKTMDLFYLILSMIIPVAGGTFFSRSLLRSDAGMGWGEALCFGIGIGLGFTAFEMFILGLLRIPFGRATAGAPLLVFTLVFFFLSRPWIKAPLRTAAPGQRLRGWRLYVTIILASWIALKIAFVFYESLTRPVYSYDTYLNWAISAKIFFYRAGLILDPGDEHFFGRGYRFFIGHPLHLPLLQTWIAVALGKFHEVYVKAPGPLYFAGVAGVLYYAVKREAGAFYALITVFFLVSLPIITVHGQDAYADLPLSFFALSGTVALWRFLRDEHLSYILLSGICFGFAMFVKNEGLFFPLAAAAALLIFLLRRKKAFLRPLAAFIIPMIFLVGPWLVFKAHYGIGFGHSGPSSGFKWFSSDPLNPTAAATGVHWEVLGRGLKEIFFTANPGLIFPLWILTALLAWKVILRTKLKYLYLIILLVFSMFVFIYLTLEVTAVMQGTGIHRNAITYLPIMFFTTALALSSIWPDRGSASTPQSGASPLSPPLTGKVADDIL